MHAKIGERATDCRAKQKSPACPNPSIHMQLGLKWNVKVALMKVSAFRQPDTTHSLFSPHTADYIVLSLSTKHGSARESDRELWAERELESEKGAKRDGERKTGGGSNSGDREIVA